MKVSLHFNIDCFVFCFVCFFFFQIDPKQAVPRGPGQAGSVSVQPSVG